MGLIAAIQLNDEIVCNATQMTIFCNQHPNTRLICNINPRVQILMKINLVEGGGVDISN